ncbi:MAG: signal peptidase I [Prevotellaceae bacterium]|jgi:signal peptidase I|nr:signal peptidase I [Prevotellaceae bacterium]
MAYCPNNKQKFLSKLFSKTVYALSILITFLGSLLFLYFGLRIFLFDTYTVNTGSMIPTILPGDRIMVNKLIYGARLYRNLDFLRGGKLQTLRIKGCRGVDYNDVVVFNRAYPLAFDISQVYAKRCIGLPGDTIWIRDGQYQNSSISNRIIEKHFSKTSFQYIPETLHACYPNIEAMNWTILNFGPLYLPRKGDHIVLDQINTWLYLRLIGYENGDDIQFIIDAACSKDQPVQTYTFKENYYFMAGDNFANSADSRYFGPIPETFIVGVVPFALYGSDPVSKKINYKRIFKRL